MPGVDDKVLAALCDMRSAVMHLTECLPPSPHEMEARRHLSIVSQMLNPTAVTIPWSWDPMADQPDEAKEESDRGTESETGEASTTRIEDDDSRVCTDEEG